MIQISVIIPVYNDADRLKLCLDVLQEQSLPHDEFEVIVVDNGSQVPPKTLVEQYPFCRFAHESKPGSYAARNYALGVATGQVLAFTDSDCLPDPEWLRAGLAVLTERESSEKIFVGGEVTIFPSDPVSPTGVELHDMAFGLNQQHSIGERQVAVTANLLVPREAFDVVGPFNANLMSAGDYEWCQRATAAGYRLIYAPQAMVRHPARATLSQALKKTRRLVGGRLDKGQKRSIFSFDYWWTFLRFIVPNIRKMWVCRQRLAKQGYGLRHWFRTLPVILAIQYTKIYEFAAHRLRGSSRRA